MVSHHLYFLSPFRTATYIFLIGFQLGGLQVLLASNNNSSSNSEGEGGVHVEVEGMTALFNGNFAINDANAKEQEQLLFEWDLGDGVQIRGERIEYTYRELGQFQYCLTVIRPGTGEVLVKECDFVDIGDESLCDLSWDPVCGCDNRTYMNACFAENQFGVYYWTAGACPDQAGYNLNPSFTYKIDDDNTFDFINSSTGTYDTFKWSFGDGTTSSRRNVQHQYIRKGKFDICLTISDSNSGEEATYCEKLEIARKR